MKKLLLALLVAVPGMLAAPEHGGPVEVNLRKGAELRPARDGVLLDGAEDIGIALL